MFYPLCSRCASVKRRKKYSHSQDNSVLRQLTLCTPEVYPAEINNLDGLFTKYVYEEFKGKMEATEWPNKNVITEHEKINI